MALTFEDRNRVRDVVRQAHEKQEARLEKGVAGEGDVTVRDTLGRQLVVADQYRGTISAVTAAKERKEKFGNMKAFEVAKAQEKVEFVQVDLQQIDYSEVEEVIHGVIAGAVIVEGVTAHAHRPGGWNPLAFKTATLDRSFSAIEWPQPVPLADMAMSGEMRAYMAGVDEYIYQDDAGETVAQDDGVSIDPAYTGASGTLAPLPDAIRQQALTGVSYSLQMTAICIEADGLTNLESSLVEQDESDQVVYHGMRWAGMIQAGDVVNPHAHITLGDHQLYEYDAQDRRIGTVRLTHEVQTPSGNPAGEELPTGSAFAQVALKLEGRPDPRTYIAGHEENTIDSPPLHAVIEITAWSEPPAGTRTHHIWHVYAVRVR